MNLTTRSLRFSYAKREVLQSLNVRVDPGALVCVVGPNGSGKSTLLRCMDRILRPSEGAVLVDGQDLRRLSLREVARRIAYVPQNASQNFPMTVFEVVMMGRKPHLNFKVRTADCLVVDEVLEMLGLASLKGRYFDELSGGEKQKVLLARALAQQAPIMLLDEPTSNLDIHYQLEVLDLLHTLKESKSLSIIMAIHDLNLAARYADFLIMLSNGQIVAQGPPSTVLTSQNIELVYRVEARIQTNGQGEIYIWPLRPIN